MELIITKDKEDLSQKVAAWMVSYIGTVLERQDRFTIALSGGSTPKRLHEILASAAFRDKIDWARIHFFWGDERYVPLDDERNNAKMAFDTLLNHVPVNKDQVHIIDTSLSPEAATAAYEKILREYFPAEGTSFDLVLLGMGDNAHTLSLFPNTDLIHEKNNWVGSFYLDEQQMYRITLTAPVVNAAAAIAFLVSGADKAAALYHVLSGEHDPDFYPAQIIQPYDGKLYWWVDEAAAADLE